MFFSGEISRLTPAVIGLPIRGEIELFILVGEILISSWILGRDEVLI
jgi:hypothetical protein